MSVKQNCLGNKIAWEEIVVLTLIQLSRAKRFLNNEMDGA